MLLLNIGVSCKVKYIEFRIMKVVLIKILIE